MFSRNIPPSCSYCKFSQKIDDAHVLCYRYGPVTSEHKCRYYVYDPLERIPPPIAKPKRFSKEDFDIDVS